MESGLLANESRPSSPEREQESATTVQPINGMSVAPQRDRRTFINPPQPDLVHLVPCPYRRFFFQFDRSLPYLFSFVLSMSLLGAPVLFYGRVLLFVGETRVENNQSDSLATIWSLVWGLAMVLQCFAAAAYKNEAFPALRALGFNTGHITNEAAQNLRQVARLVSLVVPVFWFVGLRLMFLAFTDSTNKIIWYWRLVSGLYTVVGGPSICVLVFSMVIGAALANRQILQLIEAVDHTTPSDRAWTDVEEKCVKLADEIMPAVSNGWGTMTIIFIITYWLVGFGQFVSWLRYSSWFNAVFTILIFAFSLLVFWPLAVTSSNCDRLMIAFNKRRLAHVGDRDAHHKILEVEIALRRLNLDQGLGFVIAGTVVDQRKIKQLFLAVGTSLSPVFATVMALRPAPTIETTYECLLSDNQAMALQSIAATFDSSCIFNVTIGPSGVVQW